MTAPAKDHRVVPVVVVVPPRMLLLDVAGPLEVLRKANLEQGAVRFDVSFVGPRPTSGTSIGIEVAGIGPMPDDLPPGALVLVPGAIDDAAVDGAEANGDDARAEEAIVRWLARSVGPGMRLASVCSGALLAARAGLLDGHECTTHHATISELARAAPRARIVENRTFVDSGERLTSAGVTAGIDLMLHIVARETSHATALAIARHLVVYLRRGGGDPQLSPWLEGRNHIHPAIHRAQDAVAADPARDWSVAAVAQVAGASARNLSRLFNDQAGMSVTDYVNRMRIAMAHELVTGSQLDMERVSERSGFSSARQFRRAWNRLHDIAPSRLRETRRGI